MDHLQDVRFALRQLRKAPSFTAVAVLTLALGIGATTALFSVVNGVLFKPLPYPDPERIVRVFEVGKDGTRPNQMADPNFADFSRQNRTFEAMAQFQTMDVSVSAEGRPTRVTAAQVSRGFFEVMGVQPRLGRIFHPDDDQQLGAAPTAIVSHRYWQRYLEEDGDLAEHAVRYGDAVYSVIGVMPPGFEFPEGTSVWIPRELEPMTPSRTALNKKVVGRLAEGVPLERAQEDLSGIARRLKAQYGDDIWMTDAAVSPLREELVGNAGRPLLLLLGASGFLLMVACANVINLLLARLAKRRRELGLRVALGAGRGQLAQQCLVESLLLSLLGGTLGLLVARWGVALLLGLEAGDLPRLAEIRVDGEVFLFAVVTSVVVAVGLSLLALWRSTRDGVWESLAEGQRTQGSSGISRLRQTLVVSQVTLTLMLLAGTGVLLRSFQHLLVVEPGYRTEGALVLNAHLPHPDTDEQTENQEKFHQRLISRLGALPGAAEVGGIDSLPLTGSGASGTFLLLERRDEVTDWESFDALAEIPERSGYAQYRTATPGYFRAMQIPLLRGRVFERRDQPQAPHVAVVSESLAETSWPDEDPIGQLVQFGNMDGDLRPFTVIGVVGDIREASLEAEPRPTFYANAWQRPGGLAGTFHLVVVTEGNARTLVPPARRLVHEIDPQVAPKIQTLEWIFADSLAERRFQLLLLGIFGATALLLALVGLYGVISFNVAQRTQELGVRIALGATSEKVMRLVLQQGLFLVAMGLFLGLVGALGVTHLMQSLLYGVNTTDPVTFLAVPFLLAVAATLACFLPAYRATRLDPVTALRTE